MNVSLNVIASSKTVYAEQSQRTVFSRSQSNDQGAQGIQDILDILDIGNGQPLTTDQSMQVVLERAMDKLRSVVSDARAALGIPEDAQIDTSPEATAGRIADFALGAFDKWREHHTGLADEDARKQFADFIGGAIQQGITEARGILQGLNALNPDVDTQINNTRDIIQTRLNDFVAGK